MGRKLITLVAMAALLLIVAPTHADAASARVVGYMRNTLEVPPSADAATGRAVVTIDDDTNQLCLNLQYTPVVGTISGLHIHFAGPGTNGPVVVPFNLPTTNSFTQCVTVANEALLDNIAANPGQYYCNLHTAPQHPAGALRGQLQPV